MYANPRQITVQPIESAARGCYHQTLSGSSEALGELELVLDLWPNVGIHMKSYARTSPFQASRCDTSRQVLSMTVARVQREKPSINT